MTKDEIKARIDSCRAELESMESGTGESSEPEVGGDDRRQHLEREIASLEAQIAEA